MKKARARTRRSAKAAASAPVIQCWPTDPMGGMPPLQLSAPGLPGAALPTPIIDPDQVPAPRVYTTATAEFRYWTAAEALRRGAALWSVIRRIAWNPAIGAVLPVRLDDGVDLNAYYARVNFAPQGIKQGLSFFHDTVGDAATGQVVTVFSGESADVVAHELGHAVLDGLKPALWGVATTEAAAFHESFGDMSAILTALQLSVVRQAVLGETAGRFWRNSSVSRVAEQLGYALRQRNPVAVDADSLRNAANSFVYVDPVTLPPSGPASGLSRAPHNFSRIFTGAFLEAVAGMILNMADPPGPEEVLQASRDAAQLLARAVVNAPIRTRFFQAVAEQLILADSILFQGKYAEPLAAALVRRGLLPIQSLASPSATEASSIPEAAVPESVYERSVTHGQAVASSVLDWAATDDSAIYNDCPYVPVQGGWEPTPPLFNRYPLQPCWGIIRPMVLTSGQECAPPGPPAFSTDSESVFYAAGLEVYNVGLSLTHKQKLIADYWSDGPGATGTPPGHWVAIVSQIARNEDLSLAVAAEAYARVGIAVYDAFIQSWNTKYVYNLQRPVTYINDHIDPGWHPYLVTPGFPSYTSGHATQSAAAARVLTDMFGTKSFKDTTHTDHGLVPPQQPRTFDSFEEAAAEAAVSRLFGGIHFAFDNEDGLASGHCVGQAISDRVIFKDDDRR